MKPKGVRCDLKYDRGVVTNVVSDIPVEVNSIPHHVRDLRRAAPIPCDGPSGDLREEEDWGLLDMAPGHGHLFAPVDSDESATRRNARIVEAPDRYGVVPW